MKTMRPNWLLDAALAASLCLISTSFGCKEPPPPPPPPPPVAVKPPPPPPVAEPRADKECAGPIDLAPSTEVKVGERSAVATGYKLTFTDKDTDGELSLGVLGPINEDSGANMLALRKYVKFFTDSKADAIVVTGDIGEVADGITRVLKVVAESKLPVLVLAGNRECRADFSDGVAGARAAFPNIVNMNLVRAVEFPEATLISLPGYHDPNYITCATGCRYYKSTVDEVIRVAKESKSPVVLVAHGPPRGGGSQALDYASSGGNVGDPEINHAIKEGNIPFGLFSNIKEAGARATDLEGTTLVKPGIAAKSLYLNPGPADTVGWEMNDGTKGVGMAAVLAIKGGGASWKPFRAKPLTAAEKAQAKTLEPPPRAEVAEEAAAPTPPPGEPQKDTAKASP